MAGAKKKIRKMREGSRGRKNPASTASKMARKKYAETYSTHLMAWDGDPTKKRGEFHVYPTIKPKAGKERSTNPKDWKSQTPMEAHSIGEDIKVRSRRRAEKLAGGSWKKRNKR